VILDSLNQLWTDLLAALSPLLSPEWGALIGLLPIFLVLFVVGPIVTILVLAWLRYGILRPRPHVAFADARRAAPLGEDGEPAYPLGEPYSPTERVIYEPGTTRSPSGESLVVACPKCSLVRPAVEDTCGNCGLTFTIKPTTRSLRPAGPPAGGAAAA
jgi:hypothetical protein